MRRNMFIVSVLACLCLPRIAALELGTDGCRFIDRDTGRPVFLIGAANIDLGFNYNGIPDVFVTGFDSIPGDPPPLNGSFDIEQALDSMRDYGCNIGCLYVSEHVWGPPSGNTGDPRFGTDWPWECCPSGGGFQLRQFNPVFWNKLTYVTQLAADRDIVLQVILFNKSTFWWMETNPWNPALNVNDGVPLCAGDSFHGTEHLASKDDFFCLRTSDPLADLEFENDSTDLNMLQKIYLDHAVSPAHVTTGNIIWELVNEFDSTSDSGYEWLRVFHEYLAVKTAAPVIYNPFGLNQEHLSYASLPAVNAVGLHIDHNPEQVHDQIVRARTETGKPVVVNEPLRWRNVENARRTAWAAFMAGGYYLGWKDILTRNDWYQLHAWLQVISELTALPDGSAVFPELTGLFDYWSMQPALPDSDAVLDRSTGITTCFAMDHPSRDRALLYLEGSNPAEENLCLDLKPGEYSLFWLDPAALTNDDPPKSRFKYQWFDQYILPADQAGQALFFPPDPVDGSRVAYLHRAGDAPDPIQIKISANQAVFQTGDTCRITLQLKSSLAHQPAPEVDLVAAVELNGRFYFAPAWKQAFTGITTALPQDIAGAPLLEFTWSGSIPISGIRMHAGVLASGTSHLISNLSSLEISYEPLQ